MNAVQPHQAADQLLLFQIQQMPDNLKQEVLAFIGQLFRSHNLAEIPPTPRRQKRRPRFGSAKGKYRMAADFDAPLDIFKDYME